MWLISECTWSPISELNVFTIGFHILMCWIASKPCIVGVCDITVLNPMWLSFPTINKIWSNVYTCTHTLYTVVCCGCHKYTHIYPLLLWCLARVIKILSSENVSYKFNLRLGKYFSHARVFTPHIYCKHTNRCAWPWYSHPS